MSTFLETKRLIIKVPIAEDFDQLVALQTDPEVMQYIGRGIRSHEEVQIGLEKAIQHYAKHGFSLGCVVEKNTGLFIGRAGLIYLAFDDTQPEVEVAYALTKNNWGKGYASELTRVLIKYAFEKLSLPHLIAIVHPANEKSRRVLERAGMYYQGKRKYHQDNLPCYEILNHTIDLQQVELIPATLNDYPVIQNLARFYSYDISEYYGHEPGWEMENDGLYGVGVDYKQYFENDTCFPFLIRYKGELAGFAIVDKIGTSQRTDYNMAQFFVLRTYKRHGVGKYCAQLCFDKFKGNWEVMVMPGNEGAYRFWRSVIKSYTNDHFTEETVAVPQFSYANGIRNIFYFSSR